MKDIRKTFTACLLLFSMLAFAACADSGGNSAAQTTAGDSAADTTVEEVNFDEMSFIERLTYNRSTISDNMPEKNYDGYTYVIAFLDQGEGSVYYEDWIAPEQNGDVVNDAVFMRNQKVSERFGVNFDYYSFPNTNEYSTTMTKCISSGEDAFQLISMHPSYYSSFIFGGYLKELSSMENIDESQPWWLGDSTKSYSYHGKLFTIFGVATTLSALGDSPIIYFNKNIAADEGVDDLYAVVNDGKWTCDYIGTIIKDMWTDIDGNGKKSEEDSYGLYYNHPNESYRLLWALGGRYISKDTSDEPYIDVNNDKMVKIFEKSREIAGYQGVFYHTDYDHSSLFTQGRSLFVRAGMGDISSLRAVDFNYGILPNFKLDENQEYYLTNGGGGPQGIPTTVVDDERASIIMTALNAEGYKTIMPAYYDTAVKGKYTYDEESAEMLDLVFSHVVYDPSYVFCHTLTYALGEYTIGKKEFSSWYASIEKSAEATLESNITAYKALID